MSRSASLRWLIWTTCQSLTNRTPAAPAGQAGRGEQVNPAPDALLVGGGPRVDQLRHDTGPVRGAQMVGQPDPVGRADVQGRGAELVADGHDADVGVARGAGGQQRAV